MSLSGRYRKDSTKKNKKGQPLNSWIPEKDDYICPDQSVVNTESMWRFVEDIQNDFASRANWCISLEAEEAPLAKLNMENTYYSHSGEKVIISIHQQENVEYAFGFRIGFGKKHLFNSFKKCSIEHFSYVQSKSIYLYKSRLIASR
ncbi:MAG: hypothetical protein KBT48_10630 [Firmicutes bacterium]|nr:hypothetical protein [Bacillota bacterium]